MSTPPNLERRTGVDLVESHLYDEITSLRLLPGTKISETDIAARFGVSRQPVRDAFNRLAHLDLVLIRPQRATEVRRFSMRTIEKARFVRAAVETEVLRRASALCDAEGAARLRDSLQRQRDQVDEVSYAAFTEMDYEFHQILCDIAGVSYAFDVISSEKAKVDRLCMLSLAKKDRMPELIVDHEQIAEAVIAHDPEAAVAAGTVHLSRLDATIELIKTQNAAYFEDEPE